MKCVHMKIYAPKTAIDYIFIVFILKWNVSFELISISFQHFCFGARILMSIN